MLRTKAESDHVKATIVKLQSEGMTSEHEQSIIMTKPMLLKLHHAKREKSP